MIELVGVRDLAAEDPSSYKMAMTQLFNAVREALDDADKSAKHKVTVCGFLDKCLATCDDLEILVRFVVSVRDELMSAASQSSFLRGVVIETTTDQMKEKLEMSKDPDSEHKALGAPLFRAFNEHPVSPHREWRNKEITYGYHLEVEGVHLFGKLERFKGIGIWIERRLADSLHKIAKIETVPNVYVFDSRASRFREFVDLKLKADFLTEKVLEDLLLQMHQAKGRSAKMARLYVPLLVNWIQSMDMGEKPRDEANKNDPQFLDVALARGGMDWIRGVVGYEAVIWALAERVFGRASGRVEDSRKIGTLAKLQKAPWTADVMRTDKAGVDIPEDICSLRTQNRYRTEMISGATYKELREAAEGEAEE